jgi:hypothetical protein
MNFKLGNQKCMKNLFRFTETVFEVVCTAKCSKNTSSTSKDNFALDEIKRVTSQ